MMTTSTVVNWRVTLVVMLAAIVSLDAQFPLPVVTLMDPAEIEAQLTMAEEQMAEALSEGGPNHPMRKQLQILVNAAGGSFKGPAARFNYLIEYITTTPIPTTPAPVFTTAAAPPNVTRVAMPNTTGPILAPAPTRPGQSGKVRKQKGIRKRKGQKPRTGNKNLQNKGGKTTMPTLTQEPALIGQAINTAGNTVITNALQPVPHNAHLQDLQPGTQQTGQGPFQNQRGPGAPSIRQHSQPHGHPMSPHQQQAAGHQMTVQHVGSANQWAPHPWVHHSSYSTAPNQWDHSPGPTFSGSTHHNIQSSHSAGRPSVPRVQESPLGSNLGQWSQSPTNASAPIGNGAEQVWSAVQPLLGQSGPALLGQKLPGPNHLDLPPPKGSHQSGQWATDTFSQQPLTSTRENLWGASNAGMRSNIEISTRHIQSSNPLPSGQLQTDSAVQSDPIFRGPDFNLLPNQKGGQTNTQGNPVQQHRQNNWQQQPSDQWFQPSTNEGLSLSHHDARRQGPQFSDQQLRGPITQQNVNDLWGAPADQQSQQQPLRPHSTPPPSVQRGTVMPVTQQGPLTQTTPTPLGHQSPPGLEQPTLDPIYPNSGNGNSPLAMISSVRQKISASPHQITLQNENRQSQLASAQSFENPSPVSPNSGPNQQYTQGSLTSDISQRSNISQQSNIAPTQSNQGHNQPGKKHVDRNYSYPRGNFLPPDAILLNNNQRRMSDQPIDNYQNPAITQPSPNAHPVHEQYLLQERFDKRQSHHQNILTSPSFDKKNAGVAQSQKPVSPTLADQPQSQHGPLDQASFSALIDWPVTSQDKSYSDVSHHQNQGHLQINNMANDMLRPQERYPNPITTEASLVSYFDRALGHQQRENLLAQEQQANFQNLHNSRPIGIPKPVSQRQQQNSQQANNFDQASFSALIDWPVTSQDKSYSDVSHHQNQGHLQINNMANDMLRPQERYPNPITTEASLVSYFDRALGHQQRENLLAQEQQANFQNLHNSRPIGIPKPVSQRQQQNSLQAKLLQEPRGPQSPHAFMDPNIPVPTPPSFNHNNHPHPSPLHDKSILAAHGHHLPHAHPTGHDHQPPQVKQPLQSLHGDSPSQFTTSQSKFRQSKKSPNIDSRQIGDNQTPSTSQRFRKRQRMDSISDPSRPVYTEPPQITSFEQLTALSSRLRQPIPHTSFAHQGQHNAASSW